MNRFAQLARMGIKRGRCRMCGDLALVVRDDTCQGCLAQSCDGPDELPVRLCQPCQGEGSSHCRACCPSPCPFI